MDVHNTPTPGFDDAAVGIYTYIHQPSEAVVRRLQW